MDNYFINAKLTSLRKITIGIFSNNFIDSNSQFVFVDSKNNETKLNVIRHVSDINNQIFELLLPFDYPFGENCYLNITNVNSIPIDLTNVTQFPEFDILFNYHGKLGPIYSEDATDFYLWAPLATSVILKLENKDKSFSLYEMDRINNGAYHIKIEKNLLNRKYHYLVTNNGVTRETNDPYAKAVSLDSEYSVIVDVSEIKKRKKVKPKTIIEKPNDSIIYELDIRDFTEDCEQISNKGKYLGLIEENKFDKNNNPVGLAYLKDLGITHVQILPILDFYGKGDNNSSYYNWGYDPISFFAIEGSYSVAPENPLSRIKEFADVVDKLHENDIRVVLDVVYNHVFEYQSTSFEKIVPGYYFRRTKIGKIASASGCGNDFASEKFMAKRLILDSIQYLLETFDVDGFRFDLMGLIDIDTMSKINSYIKQVKPEALIYGEGWDMGYELPFEQKTCMGNAFKIPYIGFFNDTYRDIIKGGSFKENLSLKGYLTGDLSYVYGMDFAIHGCSLPYSYEPKFKCPSQSINFIECHDNYTLFDKLGHSNSQESIDIRLKRIKLMNAINVLSLGVPFIHMGQELAQTKNDDGNTYNVSKINNFNYNLYPERIDMINSLKDAIKLRKQLKYLSLNEPNQISDILKVSHLENGLYLLDNIEDKIGILINPSLDDLKFEFDKPFKIIYLNSFKDECVIDGNIELDHLNYLVFTYKE